MSGRRHFSGGTEQRQHRIAGMDFGFYPNPFDQAMGGIIIRTLGASSN
jgi:hypothetical protein